jgi:hypothetical protein
MKKTIIFCAVCVLATLFGCNNWLPSGGEKQLPFSVDIKGLRDTLIANKDTLTISIIIPQPAAILDLDKGWNGTKEQVQIPLNTIFEIPVGVSKFSKSQSGYYITADAADEFEFREVTGSFSKNTIPKFDITTNQCVFVGKLVPKVVKSGLYIVEFSGVQCTGKGVSFMPKPKINLTDTQKNYHLLNDTLKQTAGVGGTSRGNMPFTFAFYVKQ